MLNKEFTMVNELKNVLSEDMVASMKELTAHPLIGGISLEFIFSNGYGASVISNNRSYGGPDEFELAVMKDGKVCYDTPITDDILGYLEPEEVAEYLEQIKEL